MRHIIWTMLAVIALGGCATARSPELRHVSVSFVNIVPTSSSLMETTADLTIRVTNESNAPVSLGGGAHRLFLDNTYIGRGVTNAGVEIPPLTTTVQTFQVHIENLALFNRLWNKASPDPIVSYRIESEFFAVPGDRYPVLKATSGGSIDLGTFAALKP